MTPPDKAAKTQPKGTCPLCGAPRHEKYRPFCSKRCADIDLNRWLSGRYAVPAVEADDTGKELPDTDQG